MIGLTGTLEFYRQERPQSIQRFKARVTQQTTRRLTPIPLPQVVETLNQYVRGWVGYFHYRNSSPVFGRVKWHMEERLRTHLRKRHKLKSRAAGYGQFPNQKLYARHGLFKLLMTAGWTDACLTRKNIGKPCMGKPYARFDEGGAGNCCLLWSGVDACVEAFESSSRQEPVFYSTQTP